MMELIQSSLGPITLKPELPKEWNGHILREAEGYSYDGPIGMLTLQVFRGRRFSIYYINLNFSKKITLYWKEEPVLRFQYMLKGTLRYGGKYEKQVKLRAGYLNVVWAPDRETAAEFSKGKYELFLIAFEEEMIQEVIPEFPSARIFAAEHSNQWIGEKRLDAIYDTLNSLYAKRVLHYFYKTKVEGQLLDCLSYNIKRTGKYTDDEIERIFDTNRKILENTGEPYSIEQLASEALMNEGKLARMFEEIIGVSIFERSMDSKMEKAKDYLLIGDKKIHDLHQLVGYRSHSGFIEAFRKRYGCTPQEYRQRFRPSD